MRRRERSLVPIIPRIAHLGVARLCGNAPNRVLALQAEVPATSRAVGVERRSSTTPPRPHRLASAHSHVQTRVQRDTVDVLARLGGDGAGEMGRMGVLVGPKRGWAGLWK